MTSPKAEQQYQMVPVELVMDALKAADTRLFQLGDLVAHPTRQAIAGALGALAAAPKSPGLSSEVETAFVVEDPHSSPAEPRYLSYEGDEYSRVFTWCMSHSFAIRFTRREDAEQVAAISRTAQPGLWSGAKPPRIATHEWHIPPLFQGGSDDSKEDGR